MTDLVALSDVKEYLRMPDTDTSDDDILGNLIGAADDAIRGMTGDTLPRMYDEFYDGGDPAIYVRHCPILSVQSVVESWGWVDFELVQQLSDQVPAGNIYAYSVDLPETGKISRRSAGNVNVPFVRGVANIHITYTAGRGEIPAIITLAAKELIRTWYQSALQRGGEVNTEYSYDTADTSWTRSQGVTGMNYGIPRSVVLMVASHRRSPIIG